MAGTTLTSPPNKLVTPPCSGGTPKPPKSATSHRPLSISPTSARRSQKQKCEADETLTINGKTYETHRIKRDLGVRLEIWWLDENGLPVMRHFIMPDKNKPHRIDTIIK
jgi:hypothetical protein